MLLDSLVHTGIDQNLHLLFEQEIQDILVGMGKVVREIDFDVLLENVFVLLMVPFQDLKLQSQKSMATN